MVEHIDLNKHPACSIYKDWSDYLSEDRESAVLDLRGCNTIEDYISTKLNATARNRYRYSQRNGYRSVLLTWVDRNKYIHDIYLINTSMEIRQGKPMSDSYKEFPKAFTNTTDVCVNHYSRFIGCHSPEIEMVGYITAHFCGKLAAASQILGHADHLKSGVMLNLWVCFVQNCIERGIERIVYSRWNDGNDGLKYWKHSVGMEPVILKEI